MLDVDTSGWDSEMTAYPCIVHVGDRTLLYYVGNSCAGIGVAEFVGVPGLPGPHLEEGSRRDQAGCGTAVK